VFAFATFATFGHFGHFGHFDQIEGVNVLKVITRPTAKSVVISSAVYECAQNVGSNFNVFYHYGMLTKYNKI
jgi:hypothetical protein